MNNEEEFDIGEVDMTDPIYQLWINCEDKDHKLIKSHLLGEFQYLDSFAYGALDTIKSDIKTIYKSFNNSNIKFIIVEMNTVVNNEVIENVERLIYEF